MRAVIASLARALGGLADPVVGKVIAKTVGITVLVFIALGAALYYALVYALAQFGLSGGGFAEAAAAAILAIAAFWLLFRVVALAVLQFFADEVVAAVEQRHYAAAAQAARTVPLKRDIANAARGIIRTLSVNALVLPVALILAFTAIGPAVVFLLANAVLLGRELTDMTWHRYQETAGFARSPVSRAEQVMLGAAIAGVMLVPVVNLLAPVIGAAAGAHLTHKRMAERAVEPKEQQ